VIVRVCELGKTNITMAAIEAKLKAEGYRNSGGQPWLSPNDGCVVARILAGCARGGGEGAARAPGTRRPGERARAV
jgi:hypothetical protein